MLQDLPLNDFHNMLLSKAVDLFPSLTEEDLKPYLLRSRATSAYDAVTLLARSVGVAFDQGEDSCTDTSLVRLVFQAIFMVSKVERVWLSNTLQVEIKLYFSLLWNSWWQLIHDLLLVLVVYIMNVNVLRDQVANLVCGLPNLKAILEK